MSVDLIFSLSGGGLVTDFFSPLIADEIADFIGSDLSITGFVIDLEVRLFTDNSSLIFPGNLLATGNFTEGPGDVDFADVFKDPINLGDPGDPKAFDSEPLLETIFTVLDFFTVEGKVMIVL